LASDFSYGIGIFDPSVKQIVEIVANDYRLAPGGNASFPANNAGYSFFTGLRGAQVSFQLSVPSAVDPVSFVEYVQSGFTPSFSNGAFVYSCAFGPL
jgi:hypothetical protein